MPRFNLIRILNQKFKFEAHISIYLFKYVSCLLFFKNVTEKYIPMMKSIP